MPPTAPLRLVRDDFSATPELDTAVSRALLLRASNGEIGETFRLHTPGNVVAFGKRDTLEPGYGDAVEISRRNGFAPIERLAGGRAAVFTQSTLAFAWTIPDEDPRSHIYDRFRTLADVVVDAFRRLGVASSIGEIRGEYCPGDYSVNHAGQIKLMGVGQRLARHAAHVGGVIVVDDSAGLRDILTDIYTALGLAWEPATAGALTDVDPTITMEAAAAAIVAELATRRATVPASIDRETVALASTLTEDHVPS
ncbi:MAG TPA: lipoate--protein ligase family protein [Acidimicrobiia bacterium]|jgi:lipoate-protein ligase A|nr:lipoate--protein ligase family protein [Acidimicrobiia bacterium]